jgi:diadenosine tetraphosphatase ApaH/serine/threonine PP2A family protein phosphatase
MRLAVLTDIHANATALEAVLADVAAMGADRIAVLGDIVGYGPDPGACVDRVSALVGQGALCVQGNHDAAIGTRDPTLGGLARTCIDWTRGRLTAEQTAFLRGLPLTARLEDVLLVHASANNPGEWSYVTSDMRAIGSFRSCDARLILCGHVHRPLLMSCDHTGAVRETRAPLNVPIPLLRSRRWLAVVGAVGQPRDGSPMAAWALYDSAAGTLTFRRVPYDVAETVFRLRATDLPEKLALRLQKGA